MINKLYIKHIASQLKLPETSVKSTVALLEDGATIAFISRYRKEATGSLDEVAVTAIKRFIDDFAALDKRKATVLSTIEAAGALTDSLRSSIEVCIDSTVLEDLYLPYRPKRETRAGVARAKGAEPFAAAIYNGQVQDIDTEAEKYLPQGLSVEEGKAAAADIIAEYFNLDADFRAVVRDMMRLAKVKTRLLPAGSTHPDVKKYKQLYDHNETLIKMPSYRVLAMLRAHEDGIISMKIDGDAENFSRKLYFVYGHKVGYPPRSCEPYMRSVMIDSLKRLMIPSIASEMVSEAKLRADRESVRIFGDNLRSLLLAAPLRGKAVMALDPGFRTGCKLVCLSATGDLLHNDVIYPHPPQNEKVEAIRKVSSLAEQYSVEAIAVGEGTASRETMLFLTKVPFASGVEIYSVSEDGASIYSASDVAREEFPEYDLTVRGAVSIGRRLQDPLSELVKIDPKSLGVGQYQHDVDQTLLKKELDLTVESCVNAVGVNLNSASVHLLRYVSGLGAALAKRIYDYRVENGPFTSRTDLLKVPRLGPKAYQQCVAFLRIREGGENPLDATAIHPEAYPLVERMARMLGLRIEQIISNPEAADTLTAAAESFVDAQFGLPTVTDVIAELRKPGQDPRGEASSFQFSEQVHSIEDVQPGMLLPGIVNNITAFGIFVDIGIHTSGLIPSTYLPKKFTLHLRDTVMVKVREVDLERGRISLQAINLIK